MPRGRRGGGIPDYDRLEALSEQRVKGFAKPGSAEDQAIRKEGAAVDRERQAIRGEFDPKVKSESNAQFMKEAGQNLISSQQRYMRVAADVADEQQQYGKYDRDYTPRKPAASSEAAKSARQANTVKKYGPQN